MKVSILQENLAAALKVAVRAIDSRPTLPILGNVLLEAEGSGLRVTGTNLETTVSTLIGAKVEKAGAITLPAKTLLELVDNLSPERVDLTLNDKTQTVNIRCGTSNNNVKGMSATEYPKLKLSADHKRVALNAKSFKSMIAQTVFAASRFDIRPILTGVYFEFKGDCLTMAAADGYQLAVRRTKIDDNFQTPCEMVVPAKALAEVGRIVTDDSDELIVELDERGDYVVFRDSRTTVSSQLLEGRFPDFSVIIPKSYETSMRAYVSDVLKTCKRVEIFARDSANSVLLNIEPARSKDKPGKLVISGKSAERGDAEGVVDVLADGDPVEVSFNVRYLINALNAIDEEQFVFEASGASRPGVFRPEGGEDFVIVIMPMSVKR